MLLVLTKKNFYSYKEYNKLLSNRKRLVSLYAVPGILKMEDWHFYVTNTKDFECFCTLSFKLF